MFKFTLQAQFCNISGTEGRSDKTKCRITWKTNKKYEGKYQFSLRYYYINKETGIGNQMKNLTNKIVFDIM
jgi:hypothetical protein